MQADEAAVRNALALFGSTSPSYLILQSLDAANAILADGFREKLDVCRWRLGMLCRELMLPARAGTPPHRGAP